MTDNMDLLDDYWFYLDALDETIMERIRDGLWECGDGSFIAIEDMETSHIENALAFIRRNNMTHLFDYITVFQKELKNRL